MLKYVVNENKNWLLVLLQNVSLAYFLSLVLLLLDCANAL